MHRFSAFRSACTLLLIAACMVALMFGRVAYLQTYGREQTIRRAERQQHQDETLYSRRGGIFDTNGLLMAGTVQQISLFIDPKFMQDEFQADGHNLVELDQAIAKIARYIDRNPFELSKLLGDRSASRYIRVADGLSQQTIAAIEKMKLPGVGFTPMNIRQYPMGSIASHVLGGVGADGKGLEGLELRFEKILAGRDGYKRSLKDARRRAIAVNADDYLPPQNGRHLVLTIDSNIQMSAERALDEACREYGAQRAELVVMDPTTGDVLAMCNWPTFNPANLDDSTPDVRRNRAITDPYECGSAIKPFIVGPALEWKMTRINEVFPIHGETYKSPLRPKPVTDVHGYSNLCLWDVLVKSSNIGMTMLGEHLGKASVYRALKEFQIGSATGIELPGEDPGLLRPVGKWANSDLVSAVQGYSLMVTPLQLARSMCAYANGGRLVTPRIVKGILDDEGTVIARAPQRPLKDLPETVDAETAMQIRRILADVPVRGTAQGKGRSAVYNIFGKTGTAHVAGVGGYQQRYHASFVGGAPFENPKLVIAVVIHDPDPTKEHFGGTLAGPVAKRVLEESLMYMQAPRSPRLPLPPPSVASLLYGYNPSVYNPPKITAASAQE